MPGLGSVPGRVSSSSGSLYDESDYRPLTLTSSASSSTSHAGGASAMLMTSSMSTTMSSSGYASGAFLRIRLDFIPKPADSRPGSIKKRKGAHIF
jgi:hypothetical protein